MEEEDFVEVLHLVLELRLTQPPTQRKEKTIPAGRQSGHGRVGVICQSDQLWGVVVDRTIT